MTILRFDNRVAVVTGAGNGLGKAYAITLAKRGCSVVVNDIGGGVSGSGASKSAADSVVKQIESFGGKAIANYDSVVAGDKIIKQAIEVYGRIDILINNAGILRDVTFSKMTDTHWSTIFDVHVHGSYKTARAAWAYMRKQKYGRIINVSSSSGLYGNFGQVNYGAAKLAAVGFTKGLALEGAGKNIYCNCIAPVASSRMTESLMPKEALDILSPDFVAVFVAALAHESCTANGRVFELGAGWISEIRWQRSRGAFIPPTEISPEGVREIWNSIEDFDTDPQYPTSGMDAIQEIMQSSVKYKSTSKAKL